VSSKPAEPSLAPGELVLRFLASIGRPAEAEQYLALFRSEHPERFAIIHVAEAVLDEAADALVVDLRYLAELGLRPVIAFGAVKPRPAARQAARVRELLAPFAPCAVCSPDEAAAAARGGAIALVPAVNTAPADEDGPALEAPAVDQRFDALADLATRLGTSKIVFLGRRSGLQPRDGRVVSLLDVTSELDDYLRPGVLPAHQAALLRQIARIMGRVPHPLTVSVTSPLDLLRELFTIKGAGTLVRRGARVSRHEGWSGVDAVRVAALIEDAFGRALVPAFTELPPRAVFVADDYRGAAIITDTPLGPYLSKFAVTTMARGEGVGRDLWRAMDEFPRLFWRSRPANSITAWYRDQCDGLMRVDAPSGPWVVLWRGLAPDDVPAAIAYCRELAVDFVD
jgi:acetylglutamate synthase